MAVTWFCMTCELRMIFMLLNGEENYKEYILWPE